MKWTVWTKPCEQKNARHAWQTKRRHGIIRQREHEKCWAVRLERWIQSWSVTGLDYQTQGFDHLTPGPSHYNIQDKSEDLDSSPSTAIYQLCNRRKTLNSDGLSLWIINTICKNGKYSKGKGKGGEFIFISAKLEGPIWHPIGYIHWTVEVLGGFKRSRGRVEILV